MDVHEVEVIGLHHNFPCVLCSFVKGITQKRTKRCLHNHCFIVECAQFMSMSSDSTLSWGLITAGMSHDH
jgi:hypothetical protein